MPKKSLILVVCILIFSCATKKETIPAGEIVKTTIYSESIAGALLDEKAEQSVNIYLPYGYHDSDERYPVVYFLHGFGERNRYFEGQRVKIDEAFYNGAKPFIFVEPNGGSSLGGSFYYNSEVSGNWEDYITKDLINYIDSNYKTKASKQSRGIAGFSMGGTGAVNIALSNPELFNAVYIFSPGLLKDGELDSVIASWNGNILYTNSYAAAASPNPDLDPMYEIPNVTYEDEAKNSEVINRWYKIFGDHKNKVDNYLKDPVRLDGIKINVNNGDSYKWIIEGGIDLSNILSERGVPHSFEFGQGGHNLPFSFYTRKIIPYFSEYLE